MIPQLPQIPGLQKINDLSKTVNNAYRELFETCQEENMTKETTEHFLHGRIPDWHKDCNTYNGRLVHIDKHLNNIYYCNKCNTNYIK